MDRFAKDWGELVQFYKKTEIFQIENDPISMKDWVFERDNYTRIWVMTKYFPSRKYIFVVETETLKIETSNKMEFTVVVSLHTFLEFNLVSLLSALNNIYAQLMISQECLHIYVPGRLQPTRELPPSP